MGIISLWGIFDVYLDLNDFIHYVFEVGFVVFALLSGSYMWISFRKSQKELKEANREIHEHKEELKEWARKHEDLVSHFREEVIRQLKNWKLSNAEIHVALLLLRGYSHRQVSAMLSKSERTVRNQSIEIYRKMGMTGRNELAAYFLEELLGSEEDQDSGQ
jgi:DNA-binding NarL/FixJ family response regulator